ncbi:MAG: hypothetical protein AB7N65_13130 [Vicinamibacterales bacterium]
MAKRRTTSVRRTTTRRTRARATLAPPAVASGAAASTGAAIAPAADSPGPPDGPFIQTATGRIPLSVGGQPRPEGGSSELQRAAMHWSYIVRNRQRWSNRPSLVAAQAEKARAQLTELGVNDTQLDQLAAAGAAQVVIPFTTEQVGWEGRVFPWEYVLTAATRPLRQDRPLAVFRQLRRRDAPLRLADREPRTVLYVESAPGQLADEYSFESERSVIQATFPACGLLVNPTRDQLRERIARDCPDVIHLAGFDNHHGNHLLKSVGRALREAPPDAGDASEAGESVSRLDGYILASPAGGIDYVSAGDLARLLNAGERKPLLVSTNIWNSGQRIGPLLIAAGTSATIGFQDAFSDAAVEAFFGTFYRSWQDARWNLRQAFTDAWGRVRQMPVDVVGAGLVLWTEAPIIGGRSERSAADKARHQRRKEERERESHAPLDPTRINVTDLLKCDIVPFEELNYSLLHNKRPLFSSFKLLQLQSGCLRNVMLSADLNAGTFSFPYRRVFDVIGSKGDVVDLTADVHASLTAGLARSVRESVNTSLFVEIAWGSQLLYRDTHRVRLLPPDQWRDTDDDRLWLPCFVLPRDRATEGIIAKAHRYVRVLRDDPASGFDGYQCVDPERDDPTEDVDLQVQAIWSTIVHDCRLGYVNPPPSYSQGQDSQRLRTPSCVMSDNAGTCIDLSLLFAGCLELVDIYPVIFLLKGHAFPGYWRSDEARDNFVQMREARTETMAAAAVPTATGRQPEPWVSSAIAYDEIVQQVDGGHLVPLETVKLTENCGFWQAVAAGRENLTLRTEFDSMLDIISARERSITPLPLAESRL